MNGSEDMKKLSDFYDDDVIVRAFCLVPGLRKGLLVEVDGVEKNKMEEEVSLIYKKAPACWKSDEVREETPWLRPDSCRLVLS